MNTEMKICLVSVSFCFDCATCATRAERTHNEEVICFFLLSGAIFVVDSSRRCSHFVFRL